MSLSRSDLDVACAELDICYAQFETECAVIKARCAQLDAQRTWLASQLAQLKTRRAQAKAQLVQLNNRRVQLESRRVQLDDQLAEHAQRTVDSERHAFPYVSLLPPELLAAVFLSLVHSVDSLLPTPCIAITHVCRTWRLVALDTSEVWTHHIPHYASREAMQCVLKRSKGMPLCLNLTDVHSDCLPLVLEELPRVRHLSMTFRPEDICNVERLNAAIATQPQPLAQLSILKLQCDRIDSLHWQIPISELSLQAGGMNLQRLELHGLALPWSTSSLFGLSELLLFNIVSRDPHLTEILSICRSCPQLRLLQVQLSRAVDSEVDVKVDGEIVYLRNLRHIRLEGAPRELGILLKRLEGGPAARYELVVYPSSDVARIPALLKTITARVIPRLSLREPRTVSYAMICPDYLALDDSDTDILDADNPKRCICQFSLHIQDHNERHTSLMRNFVASLPLTETTILKIKSAPGDSAKWIQNWSMLPMLTALTLYGPGGSELLSEIMSLSMTSKGNPTDPPFLPHLRHLEIEAIQCAPSSSAQILSWSLLTQWLVYLDERDTPLSSLTVTACPGLVAADFERLDLFRTTIYWDQWEYFTGDDSSYKCSEGDQDSITSWSSSSESDSDDASVSASDNELGMEEEDTNDDELPVEISSAYRMVPGPETWRT